MHNEQTNKQTDRQTFFFIYIDKIWSDDPKITFLNVLRLLIQDGPRVEQPMCHDSKTITVKHVSLLLAAIYLYAFEQITTTSY